MFIEMYQFAECNFSIHQYSPYPEISILSNSLFCLIKRDLILSFSVDLDKKKKKAQTDSRNL